MIWLQFLGTVAAVYLLIGLLVAIVRASARDMPWQLFVFAVVFWPTLKVEPV